MTDPVNTKEINPAHQRVLRYFAFDHLPEHLQDRSRPFWALAMALATEPHEDGAEVTVALRKLLEAKDAAVRAVLAETEGE